MRKLTNSVLETISLAYNESRLFKHQYLSYEELLIGISKQGTSIAAQELNNVGATVANL